MIAELRFTCDIAEGNTKPHDYIICDDMAQAREWVQKRWPYEQEDADYFLREKEATV